MPQPVKDIDNTTKHWTTDEREARKRAQQQFERKFVRLTAPPEVVGDVCAKKYWDNTVKRMKGITLLDNVDIDMLAVYCLGLSRLANLRERIIDAQVEEDDFAITDLIKLAQAQERIVLSYAEKLGLTPAGRARMARKKAEERPATEEDRDYGD